MREIFPNEPLAMGLEMFYREHQPALDRFNLGGELAALKLVLDTCRNIS
jgi:hypothetical protein